MSTPHRPLTAEEHSSLTRLLHIATGDTGQASCIADFLLAWMDAELLGSFDLTSLWPLEPAVVDDAVRVFGYIARCGHRPEMLGYQSEFLDIIRIWRPDALS